MSTSMLFEISYQTLSLRVPSITLSTRRQAEVATAVSLSTARSSTRMAHHRAVAASELAMSTFSEPTSRPSLRKYETMLVVRAQHGCAGTPVILRVPLSTVVREVPRGDPRCVRDEWEAEDDSYAELDTEERRERYWVHYHREMRNARRRHDVAPLSLDLDRMSPETVARPLDAPLASARHANRIGCCAGGAGILISHRRRTLSPKFATRGHELERATLELDLKLLFANVDLVGAPNAGGESTLFGAPMLVRVHDSRSDSPSPTIPGPIEGASDNVAPWTLVSVIYGALVALVYAVDLSGPAPWNELRMLREELDKYERGKSRSARMVIATKADRLPSDGDPEDVCPVRISHCWKEFVQRGTQARGHM
ncbi:hypothetical protein F5148DRAFT_1287340 [Russula earlei]|uniref:Uncharacterized protein n=1 Tax=Russula earlei TaxID=71964 RepID=A0ACC0U200_9AGAM|nr:hypothetical protein F5148DRAFT_1287340 [Russula earlei]